MTENKGINKTPEKIIKHFTNGISHNLILWIISKETIHGYGIMKKLDDFFNFNENVECDISISSSKIYPILSKMEKKGLISGEWKVNDNNKRVKYYSITYEGEIVLSHIKAHMNSILSNPTWVNYIEDMTGKEINYEKRN